MAQREWADKNYYADLGVSSSATPEDIKKAYRKLARDNHPDKHPGDKAAEERFKKAAEAYDILGDTKKKKEYDEFKSMLGGGFRGFGGNGGPGFPGGFRPQGGGFNVQDLFGDATQGFSEDGSLGDIFGGIFHRGGRGGTAPSRGADVETEVTIDFRDTITPTEIPLRLSGRTECTDCHGTGAAGGKTVTCPECKGLKFVSRDRGAFGMSAPCPRCHATGVIAPHKCPTCRGTGTTNGTRSLTVRIPAGVADEQKVRLGGQGEAGENGQPNGDLYVTVHVRPDPVFIREDDDICITVPVSFAELALGTTLTVPTLTSSVKMKIPAGTPNGRKMRVKGRGFQRGKNAAGDLMVTLVVEVPDTLGPGAASALRAYAQAEKDDGFAPRAGWPGAKEK